MNHFFVFIFCLIFTGNELVQYTPDIGPLFEDDPKKDATIKDNTTLHTPSLDIPDIDSFQFHLDQLDSGNMG